jgi:hypothetical protein
LDPRWDDAYLLRFLRARKFNLKDTEKMWMDFINWRRATQVDSLKVALPSIRITTSPNSRIFANSTPTAITSTTRR